MKIEHQPDRQRFAAQTQEGTAELAYTRRDGGVLDLQHTFVPPKARGRGVGAALVEHALRYAREHEQRVVPTCPFVREWLEDHPDYQDVAVAG